MVIVPSTFSDVYQYTSVDDVNVGFVLVPEEEFLTEDETDFLVF
jgi:hypothetical protein